MGGRYITERSPDEFDAPSPDEVKSLYQRVQRLKVK